MSIRAPRRTHVVPITAPSFPTSPQPQIYRKIAYTFLACTVLILVGILWFSSVRADVAIKLTRMPVNMTTTIEIAKTPTSGQITGRVVQGVYDKMLDFTVGSASTSTVSSTQHAVVSVPVAAVRARGTVRLINTFSKPQTLVRTTRLLTSDQKLYRLDRQVLIPANGETLVEVYADKLGEEFVIGPTSHFSIPGLSADLQRFIYAASDKAFVAKPESPTKTTSAATTTPALNPSGKIVNQSDIDAAYAALTQQVFDEAKKRLATEITDPSLTEVVYIVKTLDRKTNTTVGASAEAFLAWVKLEVTAVFYPKEDMMALVRARLKERIPEHREFLPFDQNSVTYTLQVADPKAETATVGITANAAYRLTSMSPVLQAGFVAGKSKDEAQSLLKSMEGVEDVHITLHPNWVSKLPSLQDRIEVNIE